MNTAVLKRIQAIVATHAAAIRPVADFIGQHPEIGYQEQQAAAQLTEWTRQQGFAVTAPASQLPTSWVATGGNGKPEIAILAEFDALPEIGHACGHQLITAAALAAGTALQQLIAEDGLSGTIKIVGTPGEEGIGGKVDMLRDGVFSATDFALICHPFAATLPDQGTLAVSRFDVSFHGLAAHAATSPYLGRNALDAMTLLFNGVNAWRQQLPPLGMVHGVITQGGTAPNIIPDHAAAFFYVRAAELKTQQQMEERFARIVQGAALMTDTECRIERRDNPYQPILVNRTLNRYFSEIAPEFELPPAERNEYGLISTDFGNVSQVVPGCNWFFQICDNGASLHSEAFKAAATTDFAFSQAMKIGGVMAAAGLRLLTDAPFRDAVTAEFHAAGAKR